MEYGLMIIREISDSIGIDQTKIEEFVTFIIHKAVQESMRMLPQVMNHIVQQTDHIHRLAIKFYDNNKDLVGQERLVGAIIEQLESQYSELSYEQLLEKAAPLARLKIKQSPPVTQTQATVKPSVLSLDKRFGDL
jgi:hypothetical protein